jgi:hypothetical protein
VEVVVDVSLAAGALADVDVLEPDASVVAGATLVDPELSEAVLVWDCGVVLACGVVLDCGVAVDC